MCVCVSRGSEWESVRVFATQREGEELVIRQVAGSGSVKIIKTLVQVRTYLHVTWAVNDFK